MALPEILFSVSLILGTRLVSPTKFECLQNLALEVALENQQIQISPGRGFQHSRVSRCPYRDILFSSNGAPAHIPAASCCDSAAGRVRRSLQPIVGHSVLWEATNTQNCTQKPMCHRTISWRDMGIVCPQRDDPLNKCTGLLQWLPPLRGLKM